MAELVRIALYGEDDLSHAAIWFLGRMRYKDAVRPLLSLVRDAHYDIARRRRAAMALSCLASKRAVNPLIRMLTTDPDPVMRFHACITLGWLYDKRALPQLISTLGNTREESSVRAGAAEALGVLKFPEAVPHLLAALEEPGAEIRYWAVYALGEIEDPIALPALRRIAATDAASVKGWGTIKAEALEAIEALEYAQRDCHTNE